MPENKRPFKGVWICAELFNHPELTPTEKFLIAEIDALTGDDDPCYASCAFFAKRLQLSEGRVANMLSKLQQSGLIHRIAFNGATTHRVVDPSLSSNPSSAKRWLRVHARVHEKVIQGSQNSEGRVHKIVNHRYSEEITNKKTKEEAASLSIDEVPKPLIKKAFQDMIDSLARSKRP